jgi:hypothetical protein
MPATSEKISNRPNTVITAELTFINRAFLNYFFHSILQDRILSKFDEHLQVAQIPRFVGDDELELVSCRSWFSAK